MAKKAKPTPKVPNTMYGVPMTDEQIEAVREARAAGKRRVVLESTPEQSAAWRKAIEEHEPEKQAIIAEFKNCPAYAKAIRNRRREIGMTLDELAESTGISKANLSRLENGRTTNPTLDTLERIGGGLGLVLTVGFTTAN